MIKTFWISLLCLSVLGIAVLGIVGIPPKSITVVKPVSNDQLPQ